MPFAFGVFLRLLLVAYIQVLHGNFLFLDDQGYDRIGWSLAQAWHMNQLPPPASAQYAGSLSYLYYVFVAALYFVLGHHWIVVKVVSALLSGLSIPAAAAVGSSLGGRRLGVAAAWVAALYPNAVFWSATGLKDGLMATLLLAMAAIALGPLTLKRLASAVVLTAMAFLSRPVLGITGLVMLLMPAIDVARNRWAGRERPTGTGPNRLRILVALGAVVVIAGLFAAPYLPIIRASLAGDGSLALGATPVAVSFLPAPHDILRSLLGPFPWSFGPDTISVYRALYPGVLIWIVMLPSAALGCLDLLRRGSWAVKGVIASSLGYIYLYSSVFQEQGYYRQRYTVEILLLIVGLYAFGRMPRLAGVWTSVGVCVIAPAALVQAHVFPTIGLAFVALALAAPWLADGAASVARALRTSWKA